MDKLKKIRESPGTGVIDCHAHAGISVYNFHHRLYPYAQNLEDLVRKTKQACVDWIICFPMMSLYFSLWKMFKEGKTVRSGLESAPFALANEYLLAETDMFGRNVLPFLMLHPKVAVKSQCRLIEKWTTNYYVYGLKFASVGTFSSARDLIKTPFPEIALNHNWPITIHSDSGKNGHPLQALDLAERFPDLRICVAHNGRFISSFWERIVDHGNVYVDTSPFLLSCLDSWNGDKTELLLLDYGKPEKVMEELFDRHPYRLIWGTDEPWTKISRSKNGQVIGSSYEDEKLFLDSLKPEIKKSISWNNPRKYLSGD